MKHDLLSTGLLVPLLSGWLLLGCVDQPRSIDLVQPGKELTWVGEELVVMRVDKRNGDSVEGIRIVGQKPDGKTSTTTADRGTLRPGSITNPKDKNSLVLTLWKVRILSGNMVGQMESMEITLKRPTGDLEALNSKR